MTNPRFSFVEGRGFSWAHNSVPGVQLADMPVMSTEAGVYERLGMLAFGLPVTGVRPARATNLLFVLVACSSGGATDTGDGAASSGDTCEPAELPAVTDMVGVAASVYDPAAACWRSADVDLDASLWGAYGDASVECNDIELMIPRVDCSCVYLGSQCGDVGAAMRGDPSVMFDEASEARCRDLRSTRPDCE